MSFLNKLYTSENKQRSFLSYINAIKLTMCKVGPARLIINRGHCGGQQLKSAKESREIKLEKQKRGSGKKKRGQGEAKEE